VAVAEATATPDTSRLQHEHDRWFAGLASVCVVSLIVLLWIGRDQWFFSDEWAFLVDRDLSRPGTLLEAHNGHWVTLPALLYRIDYGVFGLRSYLPYQVPVVVAHLAVVILVYLVSRRLGARPWIAALVSSAFIFFGAGSDNVLWGFQVTLAGSLLCGFVHLLLADHERPTARRDVLGLLVGAIGVTSSAVGIAMTVGVGAAVLVRRGRAAALLHTLPLAVFYAAWFAAYGRDASRSTSIEGRVVTFVGELMRSAFEGLGRSSLVAALLAAVAALGLAVAVHAARRHRELGPFSIAVGLVVALLSFATLTGIARITFGVESATSARYVHVGAALVLPLVAAGTEALTNRNRAAGAAPIILLAVAVPWNVDQLAHREPILLGDRSTVVVVAHSELLTQVPSDVRIPASSLFAHFGPTAGWLREAVEQGRMPGPEGFSRSERLKGDLAVALRGGPDRVGAGECPPTGGAITRDVVRGDVIRYSRTINVAAVRDGARSGYFTYHSDSVGTIDVVAGPLTIEMSGPGDAAPRLCGVSHEGSGSR
jgi:hypothetical protein